MLSSQSATPPLSGVSARSSASFTRGSRRRRVTGSTGSARSRMPKRAANLASGGKRAVFTASGKRAALTARRLASSTKSGGISTASAAPSGKGAWKLTSQ